MMIDETLLQEYRQDANEQLSFALQVITQAKKRNGEQIPVIWEIACFPGDTIFQTLQSIKVGSCFLGMQPVTAMTNLLRELLFYQQRVLQAGDSRIGSFQDSIISGLEHLQQTFSNASIVCEIPLGTFEDRCVRLGIDLPDKDYLLSSLEYEHFIENGYGFYQVQVLMDDDLVEKGRDVLEFLQQVESVGSVLAMRFDLEAFPLLENCLSASVPIRMYVAFGDKKEALASKLDIPVAQIQSWKARDI